ncbi:MAG: enoyl-CoA hydratase/isomerase family protein [Deltaproteobacteria bacterium]|nr:enoyl-CoA hydratase/isomerase family protein [Deltaproteobacteria bacterium]
MPDYQTIICHQTDAVATITINRPKVLNAMNQQFWIDFEDALDAMGNNSDVKVLIITGTGRAFSTGADLKASKDRDPDAYRSYLTRLQQISRKLIRYEKPTIAAINGYALGSGYELALACDIRIAAEDAQIGSPEARVNASVTGGAFKLLYDLVGPGKARELLFTAEYISGREAAAIGLVNKTVASDDLMAAAETMARKIAENSLFSIQMMKKGLFLAQGETSMDALMDFEIEACLACVSTDARRQSLHDFEKRKEK